MTENPSDGEGVRSEARGNPRRDWAREVARRGPRALSPILFLLVLVAAALSTTARGQAVENTVAESSPPQIAVELRVIHVGPDVDTAAIRQRLAKPLSSDFNDILALFPTVVPVNSWDAAATAVEDGETAVRTRKSIRIGLTEFACVSAMTPRIQPDGQSIELEYNLTLNRVSDGREVSFEGSPTVDDGNYHLADAVVEPATRSQLFLLAKAVRLGSAKSAAGDPAPPRLRAVDVACRVYRIGSSRSHADWRKQFEDPLPADANALYARFPQGEPVSTCAIDSIAYDGKSVTGGFSGPDYAAKALMTPRILTSGKGLVLRCELVFESKTPTPDEKSKKIVAMAFTDDDLFHLARVADDPVTSGTLLVFLKGKPDR